MNLKDCLRAATPAMVLALLLVSCAPAAAPAPTKPPAAAPPAPAATTAASAPTKAPAAAPTASTGAPTPKPAAPASTAKPSGEQPRSGGILKLSALADPPHLDIAQTAVYETHGTMELDYSGLLQYNPLENDRIIGDLGERWEASADGSAYTFYLHKEVKWHDGRPLTSEDVKFSLDRMRNPPKNVPSPVQPLLAAIKQVETVDKDTVKIVLNHPSPSIISFLAIGNMVMYPKHVIEAKGDLKNEAIGTGPYRLKAYNSGVNIEHVKNPDYFVKGRPYLDGVTFYIIKDRSTLYAAFRTRKIHLATGFAGPTVDEGEYIKRNFPEAIVKAFPSLLGLDIWPLTTKPPFNDLRVRKAIHLAFDRQAAIKVVAQGQGWIGGALPPYGAFAIPEDELRNMPGYRQPKDGDITEAKKLLAEAGYPNGFKTELLVLLGRPDEEKLAVFLRSQLANIGVDATVKVVESATSVQRRLQKAFDILVIAHGLKTLDPDDIARYYRKGSAQNYIDFADEKTEELFDRQQRTVDATERKKFALELQRRLLDTAVAINALWSSQRASYWPELKNYAPGISAYNLNKYQDVWLSK